MHERDTELSRSMHLFGADLDFDGEATWRLQRRVHLYYLFLTPHILVCRKAPWTSRTDVSAELTGLKERVVQVRAQRATHLPAHDAGGRSTDALSLAYQALRRHWYTRP